MCLLVSLPAVSGRAAVTNLESDSLRVQINNETAQWLLLDKRSGVQWPSDGVAGCGDAPWLQGGFRPSGDTRKNSIRLAGEKGGAVVFSLADGGRTLELRLESAGDETIHVLGDALTITDARDGYVIVPSREGLLIPVKNDKAFSREFGTSEYEGCHMNMLGFVKKDSALIVTWDDAYVYPNVERTASAGRHKLTTTFALRRSARSVRLMPLGKGDWNTIASEYRRHAEARGYAVTLRDKIKRDPHVERMVGASNAKLWTCLNRRMNEESTAVESVKVHWTFDEAARIAEHLRKDLAIERCFFMMGGWTEGGYDVRHPDNLPANPECGGNEALADAVKRIQAMNYVGCLHDNVQDMYRDAKSWSPSFIEKNADGSLVKGGRWLGGRAYMVCAPKQLELAQRTQNLPGIHNLFKPWSYFIDTTYAVPPRECHDPNHPIGRNDDIAWKIRLSDYARNQFGIFGSECGREWALPHSDFFEGLVGVSGHYYHQLKPEELGAQVIPFFEMVYHDCQICFGKYGYRAEEAAEYVAHHVLCARPLHYHSFPDHLYWQSMPEKKADPPADRACFTRSDNGWAEGLHPYDIFVKNTHEVLGAIHEVTGYSRLTEFRYLDGNGSVRQAIYGAGDEAMRITVNFGQTPAEITSQTGGRTVLPPWGFLAEGPRLIAFYATHWNGQAYPNGALFTLRPADGKPLEDSASIRIFHAFGPTTLSWGGKSYEVKQEEVIKPDTETGNSIAELIRDLGVQDKGNNTCNTASGILMMKKDVAVPALNAALGDPNERIRYYAVRCLGDINTVQSRNALIVAFSNGVDDVREHAAYALTWHPCQDAEQVYIDSLRGSDKYHVRHAVQALGEIKSKKAIPDLAMMRDNPRGWHVYYAAIVAMRKIESQEHPQNVLEALRFLRTTKYSPAVDRGQLLQAEQIIKAHIQATLPDVFDIFLWVTKGNESLVEPNSATILRDAGKLAYSYIVIGLADEDQNISRKVAGLVTKLGWESEFKKYLRKES